VRRRAGGGRPAAAPADDSAPRPAPRDGRRRRGALGRQSSGARYRGRRLAALPAAAVAPTSSLDDHAVGCGSAEGLGEVHLLGLCGRDDEGSGGGCAGEVGVLVDAVPEEGGEGLDALVAHVLVLVPGAQPPPEASLGLLLGILRNGAGDGEGG